MWLLSPAQGSGLKETPALSASPALPVTGVVITWPQDQGGGHSIFLSSPALYPQLPDGICSGLDFSPHREPTLQDAHSARCFHPIRVCRRWAVAEDGRVGWVFMESWQEQECYPLTTDQQQHSQALMK